MNKFPLPESESVSRQTTITSGLAVSTGLKLKFMEDRTSLPLIESDEDRYLCPGDRQPISRSLHLARLANGHLACRNCDRRNETGSLPGAVTRLLNGSKPYQELEFDLSHGIRGQYLNQLTRERVSSIVQCLIDQVDEQLRTATEENQRTRGAFHIVVGYDQRPASPDLSIGVVQALKQSSVDIIDVGQVSRPTFDFAMDQYRPHLGIYVTGGNKPAGWNGLDLVDSNGVAWLTESRLADFQKRLTQGQYRLGRTSGRYVPVDIQHDYKTAISHQFHALRPLRLGITCTDTALRETLRQLLEQTPCDVRFLQTGASSSLDWGGKSLPDLVCERHLDLGFALEQDGRACQIIDETGRELAVDDIVGLLLTPYEDLPDGIQELAAQIRVNSPPERELREQQRRHQIPVVADDNGRVWFLDESPECDGIQTLARVLEVLSLSERPASQFRTRPAPK
ncbi:hypothetical protein [Planctomicrobium sp. SH527]|uniref:hypothetical protein n=1 Tax=Planctomicrobium sp. SH527 TaxID=3448123 RepID=UPI003F5B5D31